MKPRIWPILLASGIGLAILLALGVWQVQRLAWKNALIAAADKAISGDPISLSDLENRSDRSFIKVRVEGNYVPGKVIYLISTYSGGPAWEVLRAFHSTTGEVLIVKTGKVPEPTAPPAPTGQVQITALSKQHKPPSFRIIPAISNKGDQFFEWSLPFMAYHLGASEKNFALDLLPGQPGTEGLVVEPPKADLRNNHLGYAITWFGLAAALLVMTGVFVVRIVRRR
jgi:surfeit locus 1 family protein